MSDFDPSSRSRLGWRDLGRFSGTSLFDRVGRAVCAADVLPRKELYESWEVARRARALARGARIVDLAAGHGLIAHLLLLMDLTAPSAIAVDPARPASAEPLSAAMLEAWPRLAGRLSYLVQRIEDVPLLATDLVVSAHAAARSRTSSWRAR